MGNVEREGGAEEPSLGSDNPQNPDAQETEQESREAALGEETDDD